MSSANRGSERIESDFYPTPLKTFNVILPYLPKNLSIWEPAYGDGRLAKRMIEYGLKADGNDLSYGYDFLKDDSRRECIVTNPPFSIAKSFVTHALKNSSEVYMLLRLNFLGSKERKAWWQTRKPQALFVLSERPNFILSVKCKSKCASVVNDNSFLFRKPYQKLFSIEEKENIPKSCPQCGDKLIRTSSDSCEYAWFYWGHSYNGFYFV